MANDRDKAFEILDDRTSFRWGDDNLAWVVHYPEELLDPWIKSETERRGLRPDQAEAYKKSFSDELRMGSATAVLLSVQAFGPDPIKLFPAADNIALVDSSGKRVKPMVFERVLDSPMTGLVQGFVYFPRQQDNEFTIAIKGLKEGSETFFTFDASERGHSIATTAESSGGKSGAAFREKEVIVKIPTVKKEPEKKEPPKEPEPDFSISEAEVFKPTAPPDPIPKEDDEFTLPPRVQEDPSPQPVQPVMPMYAPRQLLDIYMKAWINADIDMMYSLLTAESRGRISKELFESEVLAGGFRGALKSGYKVTWLENETAKITVARKILFVRTLDSKHIKFELDDGTYRVSW